MTQIICKERLCTGCGACFQICPQSAISMTANDEGFLYPHIDEKLCNNCGLCRRTCPVNRVVPVTETTVNAFITEEGTEAADACDFIETATTRKDGRAGKAEATRSAAQHKVYASYSGDDAVRAKSSSGGVFTELALSVLRENGVVFGAGFDSDFRVSHSFIDNEPDLDGLRRSKYVQSDTKTTFCEVRAFLKEGRRVLYCGTPCQIAGLKAYLNQEDPKLLTCDLACHGVPSPKVWGMYLDYIRDKYSSAIKDVSFRDKSTGWNDSSMRIDFEDGRRYMDRVKRETFFIGFGKSVFNRKSCFDCQFRIDQTKADITLADFWGIDRQDDKEYSDNKGVSLVIVHTAAGNEALYSIADKLFMKERSLDEAVRFNPRLVSSVKEPAGRISFFNDMQAEYSFDRLKRKYMDNESIRYKVKGLLKRILGKG